MVVGTGNVIAESGWFAPALNQLPPPVADFTGRDSELRRLAERVVAGDRVIGIFGMGGVGKTSLANRLADGLRQHFRDGQLFLSISGTGPNPPSAREIMASLVQAFEPKATSIDAELLPGKYRSLLYNKAVLLLLDNAASPAQIEDLLPPDGCVLIITSRQRFALPGMFSIVLKPLPPSEARNLLVGIAPRAAQEADRIVNLCAGLPLAIRLAGGALVSREDLRPSRYADRLEDEHRRLELLDRDAVDRGIRASLQISVAMLPHELLRKWSMLTVFPAHFESYAASKIWEIGKDESDDWLSELTRLNLAFSFGGRYWLHDLVRLFGAISQGDAGVEYATLNYVRYFTQFAALIAATANRGEFAKATAMFEVEWNNLRRAHEIAASRMNADTEAAKACIDMTEFCSPILQRRAPIAFWRSWYAPAVSVCRLNGDLKRGAVFLSLSAHVFAQQGKKADAAKAFSEALGLAEESADAETQVICLNNWANTLVQDDDYRPALRLLRRGVRIARRGDVRPRQKAVLYSAAGRMYGKSGRTKIALCALKKALELAQDAADEELENKISGHIGSTHLLRDEFALGIPLVEARESHARQREDLYAQMSMAWLLFPAFRAIAQKEKADAALERAIILSRRLGIPVSVEAEQEYARCFPKTAPPSTPPQT